MSPRWPCSPPDGRLARWLYGIAPDPDDLRLALTERGPGRTRRLGPISSCCSATITIRRPAATAIWSMDRPLRTGGAAVADRAWRAFVVADAPSYRRDGSARHERISSHFWPPEASAHAARSTRCLALSVLVVAALGAGLRADGRVRGPLPPRQARRTATRARSQRLAGDLLGGDPVPADSRLLSSGRPTLLRAAPPPADALEIDVVAKQWMWKFQHPGGQREINELHVPAGQPVKLTMTSQDVIHSLYMPALRHQAGRAARPLHHACGSTRDRPGTYRAALRRILRHRPFVMGGRLRGADAGRLCRLAASAPTADRHPRRRRAQRCSARSAAAAATAPAPRVHAPPLDGLYGRPVRAGRTARWSSPTSSISATASCCRNKRDRRRLSRRSCRPMPGRARRGRGHAAGRLSRRCDRRTRSG